MRRRDFLFLTAVGSVGTLCGCQHLRGAAAGGPRRLFYTSAGKTCVINADGSGQETLSFDVPNQATWQPGGFFRDGRRAIFLSMEPRRDGPGRPFGEYYHLTPTHIWAYDLESKTLTELATKDRLAPFCTPQLLLSDERMLVQVVRKGEGQTYSMNLDGSDARPFTQAGEGMPYGLSASPDGKHVAFHLASPKGYQIWTSDAEGGNRVQLAGAPGHLYFGTNWSPDSRWVLYVDCQDGADPGHDWADVCISRGDGSEQRVLTTGQAMWFAATYGGLTTRGGGSNVPEWTRDGAILFPRRLPDSKVAWEYRVGQSDTDHFNREYKPESARGGTEIVRLNSRDASAVALTHSEPPVWDFRATESPDGRLIAFCRCAVGEAPALWVMNSDGSGQKLLTRGVEDSGADHPRWFSQRADR